MSRIIGGVVFEEFHLDDNGVYPDLNGLSGFLFMVVSENDMFAGHQQEIRAERDRKLEAAWEQRKNRRQLSA